MIAINEWRGYIRRLANANSWIRRNLMVVDIAHLKDRIKEFDGVNDYPLLVGVMPSSYSHTTHDEDNVSELNVIMLFVLIPLTREDEEAEMQGFDETQQAMAIIKRTIREDYFDLPAYPFLQEIKFKSYAQDAVYNMLSYNGWSLAFEIETDEY